MARSFSIKAKGASDVGQLRSSNQDAFLVANDSHLFIVADGMGGHAGGEIASKLCIEKIENFLQEHAKEFTSGDVTDSALCAIMVNSVNHASAKIYEHALEEPSLRGMGTTATVVKLVGKKAFSAHVGDSRLYLIRSGFLYQMTYDHSLVNEQLRAGIISAEEAELHHLKNVITRSVGYQEEEDVDTVVFDLEEGDYLLLCSDGLHGKVEDQEIAHMVINNGLSAATQLIDLANKRGGEDNITVVIIAIQA